MTTAEFAENGWRRGTTGVADVTVAPWPGQNGHDLAPGRGTVHGDLSQLTDRPLNGALYFGVLAVAAGNQYAWSHHHPHAVKAGVTQQELDSLESGAALAGTISPPEKAAIRYAPEFGQGGKVTDETFAEAKRHFSERQITDRPLLCGYFMARGSTINALRVELEPTFPPKAKRA